MIEFISDIAEAEHELRAVQDELAAAQALLFRKRVEVSASFSPIGALPPELIRMILSHVCDASHPILVMRLSHVSRMWREAIISNSSLFTCANWDLWNHMLVRLWCTRAGSKPLTIKLGADAMCDIINHEGGRRLCDVFTSCVPQLRHLHIQDVGERGLMQDAIDFINFSCAPAPLLTHMTLRIDERRPFQPRFISFCRRLSQMPALRVLDLGEYIHPDYMEMRPQLKSLSFVFPDPFAFSPSLLGDILGGLGNLEYLCVRMSADGQDFRDDSSGIILSSLKHLKLANAHMPSRDGLFWLLDHLTTPQLEAVTLFDFRPTACWNVYEKLVSRIFLRAVDSV